MPTCADCKFYESTAGSLVLTGHKSGACHRHPPQGFMAMQSNGMAQIMYRHPEVQTVDWCGEWLPGQRVEIVEDDTLWTYSAAPGNGSNP